MRKQNEQFTAKLSFRVTQKQNKRINEEFEKSVYPTKAQFLRTIFDDHKANEAHILEWKATIAAGELSDELNAQGNNFNQLVRAINSGMIKELSAKDKQVIENMGLLWRRVKDVLINNVTN